LSQFVIYPLKVPILSYFPNVIPEGSLVSAHKMTMYGMAMVYSQACEKVISKEHISPKAFKKIKFWGIAEVLRH
jgi:hypothetical protein